MSSVLNSLRCRPRAAGCKKVFRAESGEELDLEAIKYPTQEATSDGSDGNRGLFAGCKPQVAFQPAAEDSAILSAGDSLPYKADSSPKLTAPPIESSTPYIRLEGDEAFFDDEEKGEAEKLLEDLASVKKSVGKLRTLVAVLTVIASTTGVALLSLGYEELKPEEQLEVRRYVLLGSIPVVALLFTWFHIWLAIQMMFLPLEFAGIWQYGKTGMGVGWQGLVPRKCEKMARSSYSCARPYLDGPRDWLTRVDPKKLVAVTKQELRQVIDGALAHVTRTYFPRADQRMPASVRSRITDAALERIQESSPELWKTIIDLLCDDVIGIDNDGMIVKVFTENKELLNEFFLTLGDQEFRFIEHCGAAMGFICGCLQLAAFNHLSSTGRAIFLPVTGFFLGIVTNWLAILMVFKPVFPVPVRICGYHVLDIQGLFLKRQHEVAVLYSKMLKDNFLSFPKVIGYLQTLPELWEKLKAAYTAHSTRVLNQTLGSSTTWLAEWTIGQQQYKQLEEDLKVALVQGLYHANRLHQVSGNYIGKVSDIEARNRESLQKMPPDEFENLLHPVFKEDEWILILLGGVLGAIVGIAQVHFLSS